MAVAIAAVRAAAAVDPVAGMVAVAVAAVDAVPAVVPEADDAADIKRTRSGAQRS